MSKSHMFTVSRREFIKGSVLGLAILPALGFEPLRAKETNRKAEIALFKTQDRKEGVRRVLKLLDFPPIKGKHVLLKPNFNTADSAPGSTHNDTLSQLILELKERGASEITIGERSGPPPTSSVLEDKGMGKRQSWFFRVYIQRSKIHLKMRMNLRNIETTDGFYFYSQTWAECHFYPF